MTNKMEINTKKKIPIAFQLEQHPDSIHEEIQHLVQGRVFLWLKQFS